MNLHGTRNCCQLQLLTKPETDLDFLRSLADSRGILRSSDIAKTRRYFQSRPNGIFIGRRRNSAATSRIWIDERAAPQ